MTRLSSLVDNVRIAFTAGKLTWHAVMAAEHDALVAAAQAPGSRRVYPVEYYTPESASPGSPVGAVALTDANIAAAIRAAVTQAQSESGGIIQIPPGQWALGNEEIVITCSTDRDKGIVLRGAGMDVTALNFPDAYTGTGIKFTPTAAGLCYNNGVEALSINCLTAASHNTGTGLHLEAQINFQAQHITIRNFLGGTGLKTRKVGTDQTNQYCQLHDFTVAGCNINYDLKSFVNCQGYGVFSASGVTRDYLFDDAKFSIYGGNTQTSAPVAIEFSGNGGCRVAIYDYYYEGFAATIFKLSSPSGTSNQLDVNGFHLGGSPTVLLDTDVFNNATLRNIYLASNATTIVKARNGSPVILENCGDPITQPGKFDLDAASRAVLVCTGMSDTQFTGASIVAEGSATSKNTVVTGQSLTGSQATAAVDVSATWNTSGTPAALKVNVTDTASNAASKLLDLLVAAASMFSVKKDGSVTAAASITATTKVVATTGFALPGFATGAEPGSPVAGDLVRDSTYDRPTFRNGSSAWKRVAFVDDDNGLTALLTPHCAEIWDPRIYTKRSVIAGELDTLTGVLNGTVISAPASGQRPAWNATDEVFGNRPSFSCAFTGTRYLSGTLAATIAAGSRPGLFVVFRCTPGTLDANRRFAAGIEHGADHSSFHGVGMTDLNVPTAPYGFLTGATFRELDGAALLDAYGHVVMAYSDTIGRLNVDLSTQVTSADPGVTSNIVDTALLGAAWNGAAFVGCNVTVAYCAVLKEALDVDTQARVLKLAMSQYGLR